MNIDVTARYCVKPDEAGTGTPRGRILSPDSPEAFDEEELMRRIVAQVRLVLANVDPNGCDLVVRMYTQ